MSVIEIEDLGIRRGAAALQGVSLRVGEGESVAVVGDDQASLTLLVRCCGACCAPIAGTCAWGSTWWRPTGTPCWTCGEPWATCRSTGACSPT